MSRMVSQYSSYREERREDQIMFGKSFFLKKEKKTAIEGTVKRHNVSQIGSFSFLLCPLFN